MPLLEEINQAVVELGTPIGFVAGNIAPLLRYTEFLVRVATELSDGRARTPDEIAAVTRLSPVKDLGFVARDVTRLIGDLSEGARRARLILRALEGLTGEFERPSLIDRFRALLAVAGDATYRCLG